MNNELVRYATGDVRPRIADIAIARKAKQIHDEVRLTALKVDGAMALAGHIMEGLVAMDDRRRQLAKDDPVTNEMLARIEATAVNQIGVIQMNLYNGWRL